MKMTLVNRGEKEVAQKETSHAFLFTNYTRPEKYPQVMND